MSLMRYTGKLQGLVGPVSVNFIPVVKVSFKDQPSYLRMLVSLCEHQTV